MSNLTYDQLVLPYYKNTTRVIGNLDVTDIARASVIGGLNLLLVGDTGCGKTQLARDIFNYWYGGPKQNSGEGVFIRVHPELDLYQEHLLSYDEQTKSFNFNENTDAMLFVVDEINRLHPYGQNQFMSLGDGSASHKGRIVQLGKEGIVSLVATANIGNGEFMGTFKTDRALFNRLHVVLDFDYRQLMQTKRDVMQILSGYIHPNVKDSMPRDITHSISTTRKEIDANLEKRSLESKALEYYLIFGLQNCMLKGVKDKSWQDRCEKCAKYDGGDALCARIYTPSTRVIQATTRLAYAMDYLSKLKNTSAEISKPELFFKAFELTSPFQIGLRENEVNSKYYGIRQELVADLAEKLKLDFIINQDFIMTSLQEARSGKKITSFFKNRNGDLGTYDNLSDKAKGKVKKIEPFTDQRAIGLGWVNDAIEEELAK